MRITKKDVLEIIANLNREITIAEQARKKGKTRQALKQAVDRWLKSNGYRIDKSYKLVLGKRKPSQRSESDDSY